MMKKNRLPLLNRHLTITNIKRTKLMKKALATAVVLFLAVTSAFAHAGHAHTYSGTVTTLHSSTEFTIKTIDGKDVTITSTPETAWLHADGHTAEQSQLAVGSRVVVKMNTDGKTAATVKMSAPPNTK
jgi:hypothetical protein